MNNRDKYKRTFSVVRTSRDYGKGVLEMSQTKTKRSGMPKIAILVAAICLAFGTAGVCYAADVGGIQRQIQLWINGDQTDAVIEFDGEGGYMIHYPDENGETHSRGGGGVAIDHFGNERPLTEQELLEELNSLDVRYEDDGRVMVYYYDQALDITDMFDEDGVCYVTMIRDDQPLFVTVKYRDGFAASSRCYVDP